MAGLSAYVPCACHCYATYIKFAFHVTALAAVETKKESHRELKRDPIHFVCKLYLPYGTDSAAPRRFQGDVPPCTDTRAVQLYVSCLFVAPSHAQQSLAAISIVRVYAPPFSEAKSLVEPERRLVRGPHEERDTIVQRFKRIDCILQHKRAIAAPSPRVDASRRRPTHRREEDADAIVNAQG